MKYNIVKVIHFVRVLNTMENILFQQLRGKARQTFWRTLFVVAIVTAGIPGGYGKNRRGYASAQTPHGAAYYVAPTGDDSNPGSEKRPWKTIQKAAETLRAGDTVYIRSGTYREAVTVQHSGKKGKFIVYSVYPGETAIVDGAGIGLPEWGGLFNVFKKSYIRVSGLRFVNAGPNPNNTGILVERSKHIIIDRNSTYNTKASGIGVWYSANVIIDSNEVELACNDGKMECISVVGTKNFEVKYNHVHHSGPGTDGGEGIDVLDGSSYGKVYNNYVHHINRIGIYIDAWEAHTHHIEVFGNVVHDCAASGLSVASEAGGLLEAITLRNNISYWNKTCGLSLSGCCESLSGKHPMQDIRIVNNTFYRNSWDLWGGGICVNNPDAEDVLIRNNILSQNTSFQIFFRADVSGERFTIDHNLIDACEGCSEDELSGVDVVKGNPQFEAPDRGKFRLQKGSPAIDSGSAEEAPDDDFERDTRPQGYGYDIGADEYSEPRY